MTKTKKKAYSEGFLLRKIKIYKFNLYENQVELNLNGNLVGILGENGTGKSSIIDALTYTLFGTTSRTENGMTQSDIIQQDGFVELIFEKHQKLWKFKRSRETKSRYNLEGFYFQDGKWVALNYRGITKTEEYIHNILKIDYNTFINTILIRQDEITNIAETGDRERGEVFEKIFNLKKFDTYRKQATQQKKTCKTEKIHLEKEKSIITGKLSSKKQLTERKKTLEKTLDETNQQIEVMQSEIKTKSQLMQALFEDYERYAKTHNEFVELKKILAQKQAKLKSSKAKNKSQSQVKQQEIDDLKALMEKEEPAREKIQKGNEFSQLLSKKKVIEDRIREIRSKMKTKLENSKKQFSLTEPEKRAKLLAIDFKENKTTYHTMKNGIEWEFLTQKVMHQFLQQSEDSIQKLEQQKVPLNKEINELLRSYPEVSSSSFVQDHQKVLQQAIKARNEYSSKIQIFNQEKQELSYLTQEIKELTEKIETNQEILEKGKKSYTDYETLKKEKETQSIELQKLQVALKTKQENLEEIQNDLVLLEKEEEKMEEIDQEIAKIDRQIYLYDTLANNVFHPTGVPFFILSKIFESLSEKASYILHDLYTHREDEGNSGTIPRQYQKIDFYLKSSKSGRYGVEIKIHDQPISRFSGGEKIVISYAIRLAIAILLSELRTSSISCLIMDECKIGSLDKKSRTSIISMINSLDKYFKQTILITHDEELMNSPFDVKILTSIKDNSCFAENV